MPSIAMSIYDPDGKIFLENSEKQNSSNSFDEIGNLFSNLSSLLGLQN
jgi:hypothetical protein